MSEAMVRYSAVSAIFMAAFLAGCSSFGSATISASRPAYNQAIKKSSDQELLLNLVRISYTDSTYFTSVDRIAASYELNRSISGNLIGKISDITSWGISELSLGVNEMPTIFYSPLDGEKFVRQMLTPINPELLLLIIKSGWPLDIVFSVAVQEINGLRNAPSATGPKPESEPVFREFKEVIHLLRILQRAALIDFRNEEGVGIEMRFIPSATYATELARLRVLLRLKPEGNLFPVIAGTDNSDSSKIALSTRPLISALSYLSQGIEPPQIDIDAGRVRTTRRADGSPFNWQEILGGVFRVRSSATEPVGASVVVPYRGSYFYIADDDIDSKATFVLVNQLMALTSGSVNQANAVNFMFGKSTVTKGQNSNN